MRAESVHHFNGTGNIVYVVSRPRTIAPNFRFSFWIEGKGRGYFDRTYSCKREDLEAAITQSGIPESLMRSRMGAGFHYLADALGGGMLDRWQVAHIETGMAAVSEQEHRNLKLGEP